MKLKPLTSEFEAKISKKLKNFVSKRFRADVLTGEPAEIECLILLGNGDTDDLVVPVVCHHLNGSTVAGVAKPVNPRLGALDELLHIISRLRADRIALVMDQERDAPEKIYGKVEECLRRRNVRISSENLEHSRAKMYRCRMGSGKFELVVILSGTDDTSDSFKIEDHLIKARSMISGLEYPEGDAKEHWRSMSMDDKREVLKRLVESRELCERALPQHFAGLSLLKD